MGSKSIFLQNGRGEYDLKVGKMQNAPCFTYFFREIYTWNVLFDCIYLSICSKSMGSRTHLQNSMGSAEPMEPMLTQPLLLCNTSCSKYWEGDRPNLRKTIQCVVAERSWAHQIRTKTRNTEHSSKSAGNSSTQHSGSFSNWVGSRQHSGIELLREVFSVKRTNDDSVRVRRHQSQPQRRHIVVAFRVYVRMGDLGSFEPLDFWIHHSKGTC